MSVFIDRKYLLLLSPKLNRFTQKKEDLYNFRCPICGDSQKNLLKARGYVYRKGNDYYYKCQNCGAGHTMYNFIKFIDQTLLKNYSMERYTNGDSGNSNYTKPEFKFERPVFKKKNKINLQSIDLLEDEHYAKQYVMKRKLPTDSLNKLYFAQDFKKFVDELIPDHGKDLLSDDPRLVIPFYDKNNELIALQGRALSDSKLRYITIKIIEDGNKLFGSNTINLDEKIYVTEGPLDSLFLPNCVATADSNLSAAANYLPKDKLILVFDNEPRNKDIVNLMDKAIENHFNVCIWPDMMQEKDINDMVLSGFSPEEIKDIIDTNTFVNLRAKMEFIQWKNI